MKRQNTTQQKPRLFQLVRHTHVSGVRGTGTLAEGVEWSDGAVTLRWRGRWPATSVWDGGIEALLAVHGHNGRTQIHWLPTLQQLTQHPTPQPAASHDDSQRTASQDGPQRTTPQDGPQRTTPQDSPQRTTPQDGPQRSAPRDGSQRTASQGSGPLWLPAAGVDGLCARCGRGWPCLGCDP